MDAKTGEIKWSYNSGGPCNAGASISDGMVFWGTGTYMALGRRRCSRSGCNALSLVPAATATSRLVRPHRHQPTGVVRDHAGLAARDL